MQWTPELPKEVKKWAVISPKSEPQMPTYPPPSALLMQDISRFLISGNCYFYILFVYPILFSVAKPKHLLRYKLTTRVKWVLGDRPEALTASGLPICKEEKHKEWDRTFQISSSLSPSSQPCKVSPDSISLTFHPHLLFGLGRTWSFPAIAPILSLMASSVSVTPGGSVVMSSALMFEVNLSQCHVTWVSSALLKIPSITHQSTYFLSWDVHHKTASKIPIIWHPKSLKPEFPIGIPLKAESMLGIANKGNWIKGTRYTCVGRAKKIKGLMWYPG